MSVNRLVPIQTEVVDFDQAVSTLSARQMLALAQMFENWCLNDRAVKAGHRQMLGEKIRDYRAIVDHCGPDWMPDRSTDPPDLMGILAEIAMGER